MYRCAACDVPQQMGHSLRCPVAHPEAEHCFPYSNGEMVLTNDSRLFIGSGEDVTVELYPRDHARN